MDAVTPGVAMAWWGDPGTGPQRQENHGSGCYPESPRIMVRWNLTLNARKLLLEIHPFST